MAPIALAQYEVWKEVHGWPYEVSNLGRVRRSIGGARCRVGHVLRPAKTGRPPSSQYLSVSLCKDGKPRSIRVHILVASVFLGPCPVGYEVDHKNGDHFDNKVTNLEYVTHSENQKRAYARGSLMHLRRATTRLDDKDIQAIRQMKIDGASRYEIAERFQIHPVYASAIACGRKR